VNFALGSSFNLRGDREGKLNPPPFFGRPVMQSSLVTQSSRTDDAGSKLLTDGPPQAEWRVLCLSTVQEMPAVLETVLAVMAEAGYSRRRRLRGRLVLEEALCNAIKHGHRHDPDKVVQLRFRIRAGSLWVEVEDQGPGFDPSQVPDAASPENLGRSSGRGLLLMRHYAASVRYNRKGNRVTIGFHSAAPGPAAGAE
jgi:serine/threonine-protein kinase RsbW